MVKVGAIIQVRLGSERLPNKALLPLPFGGGPNLIEHVVTRASAAKSINQVIVATTDTSIDSTLSTFCQERNIDCFRGSEQDVLDRVYTAAKDYNFDIIVRLTGDNPFIMPDVIDNTVETHLATESDYSVTYGLPLGTNIEVISLKALDQAVTLATELADREHVTPYIRRQAGFKRNTIEYNSPLKDVRLTVDYPSDYALANMIYDRLFSQNTIFGNNDLEELFRLNQWLVNINGGNTQRQAFSNDKEEFESAITLLNQGGFTRVLQKLQEAGN